MKLLKDRLAAAIAASDNPDWKNQTKLAKRAGVTQSAVNQWLSGTSQGLKGDSLAKVAEALGVSALWLGTGKGAMKPAAGQSQAVGFDPVRMAEALRLLDQDETVGGEYSYPERSRRLIELYEAVPADGRAPPELTKRILTEAMARRESKGERGDEQAGRGDEKRATRARDRK